MTSELMLLIQQDLDREHLRFGSVTININFHDGQPTSYELTTRRRRNIDSHTHPKIARR